MKSLYLVYGVDQSPQFSISKEENSGNVRCRCSACGSESDLNCEICEICGEPTESVFHPRRVSFKGTHDARNNPFKVHCEHCNSECDITFLSCQICGESIFKNHYQAVAIKSRMNTSIVRQIQNQCCRSCGSLFSCFEDTCSICGCRSGSSSATQGSQPMEWVRATVKVRSPSGIQQVAACESIL
jgi:hypothetical protein